MHTTTPAHCSFRIIARSKTWVGFIGFLLPVRARELLVIVGVSPLPRYENSLAVAIPPKLCRRSEHETDGRFCPCASNGWWYVTNFSGRTGSGIES